MYLVRCLRQVTFQSYFVDFARSVSSCETVGCVENLFWSSRSESLYRIQTSGNEICRLHSVNRPRSSFEEVVSCKVGNVFWPANIFLCDMYRIVSLYWKKMVVSCTVGNIFRSMNIFLCVVYQFLNFYWKKIVISWRLGMPFVLWISSATCFR